MTAATYRYPERLAQMQAMYEQGYTLNEVGARFNVDGCTVYYAFKRYGVPRRQAKPRNGCRDKQRLQHMANMYTRGCTTLQIAEQYGITRQAVSNMLNRYGFMKGKAA